MPPDVRTQDLVNATWSCDKRLKDPYSSKLPDRRASCCCRQVYDRKTLLEISSRWAQARSRF